MTSRMIRAGIALAMGLGLALLATSQTRTPGPAVSPTPPVASSLTPAYQYKTSPAAGMGGVLGSTTPGYASNLYSIPVTTPIGMPAYAGTPPALTVAPRRPMSAADCGRDGWQSYSGLGFTSQKDCESWASRHPAAGSLPATESKTGSTKTRIPQTTPSATSPVKTTTRGFSITPLLNSTPGTR